MSIIGNIFGIFSGFFRALPLLLVIGVIVFIIFFANNWYEDNCVDEGIDNVGECVGEKVTTGAGSLIVGAVTGVATSLFRVGNRIGEATFPAVESAGTGLANLTRRLKFW